MINPGFQKYLDSKKKGSTVNNDKKVVAGKNSTQAKDGKAPGKVPAKTLSWTDALAALKKRYGK